MNPHRSKSLSVLAAALMLAAGTVAAQDSPIPARSAVGVAIADQGNVALLRIRDELARHLKHSVALPRLDRDREMAGGAEATQAQVQRISFSL